MEAKSDKPLSQFDQLCIENPHILRKIVNELPIHHRLDYVGAISRYFYETVCDMDKLKYTMKLNGIDDEEDESWGDIPDDVSKSILNSGRIFDTMELDQVSLNEVNIKVLKKIAEKFGASIKSLATPYCWFPSNDIFQLFLEFLQYLPNLETLKLNHNFDHEEKPSPSPRIITPIFTKLKKLSYKYYSDPNGRFDLRLISPHTIDSLEISGKLDSNAKSFILQQSKITSLYVENSRDGSFLWNANALKHLKLERFIAWNFSQISQLVRDHPTLRRLYIFNYDWSSTSVQSICQHAQQLQELFIKMTNENCFNMCSIVQLKQLRKLWLKLSDDFTNFEMLENFSKLNMPSISIQFFALDVNNCDIDAEGVLQNFGAYWENIEDLEVQKWKSEDHDVSAILKSFKKLKALSVSCELNFEGSFPQLKTFKVHEIDDTSLAFTLEALPNLTHLSANIVNTREISIISTLLRNLASHENLKKLEIMFTCGRVLKDFIQDLKELCHKISKYRIVFFPSNPDDLSYLTDCIKERAKDFCEYVKIVDDFDGMSLALTNCSVKEFSTDPLEDIDLLKRLPYSFP